MEKLEQIIFYTVDKAIKTYRQFAQRRLNEAGLHITIDQWLVLKAIMEKPEISQLEIADIVFKDAASVTRIIDLLVKKNYLQRMAHDTDRRRFSLHLTNTGSDLMKNIASVVAENRKIALAHISEKQLEQTRQTLITIINNCQQKVAQ